MSSFPAELSPKTRPSPPLLFHLQPVLRPPLPGGDAIAFFERTGEMQLVRIPAPNGNAADGPARPLHHVRRLGKTQADKEFLRRAAHALFKKLAEIVWT